jgi:hypothetical protein
VKHVTIGQFELISPDDGAQDCEQKEFQPGDEASEVVTGGGEHGVNGVAGGLGEVIAAHAVIVLEIGKQMLVL